MAVGTSHSYCLSAINPDGYGHEGYSSVETITACTSHTVHWESILTGRVTLGAKVGSLPVEGPYLLSTD